MVTSRGHNAGQSSNIKTGNKSFETVKQYKYLGTNLKNQNSIHEGIKSKMKLRGACHHSVQIFCFPVYIQKCKD